MSLNLGLNIIGIYWITMGLSAGVVLTLYGPRLRRLWRPKPTAAAVINPVQIEKALRRQGFEIVHRNVSEAIKCAINGELHALDIGPVSIVSKDNENFVLLLNQALNVDLNQQSELRRRCVEASLVFQTEGILVFSPATQKSQIVKLHIFE